MAGPASVPASAELVPRLHSCAPSHLFHLLQEFDEGVSLDAPNTALRALRGALGYLLGFCTDLLSAACVELGASKDLFLLGESEKYRPAVAEGRLKEALYFLSNKPDEPLSKTLVSLFFDSAGDPHQFYLLTQGGRVEGKMGGLDRVSDFASEPRRSPSRRDAFKLRSLYLPHLESWLVNLNRFFEVAELVTEYTELDGSVHLTYELCGVRLSFGARVPVEDCKACRPSRLITVPKDWVAGSQFLPFPESVPEHALHLVDRWKSALDEGNVIESTRLLRDTLEFLLRYFAGVGKTLGESLGCLPPESMQRFKNTESVDVCENLLQVAVESLKAHQDDVASRDFVGVFYRRDANLVLQPRSHTNILLMDGVLSSWFKQERGREPSEERYAKDFRRFFPLLRDWVGSMGPFFSHTENFDEPPTLQGQLPITVRCGEHLLELTEENYNLRIRQCPVCLPNPAWLQVAKEEVRVRAQPDGGLSAEQLIRRANQKPEMEAETVAAPEVQVPKVFPGEFRPIELPADAPKFLQRILRRVNVRVLRGELEECRDAVKDAIDYLVRYWAGVVVACRGELGDGDSKGGKMASGIPSIHQCEESLTSGLESLVAATGDLAQEVVQVFFVSDLFSGEKKPRGTHYRMLATDADQDSQMQLLADFCDAQAGVDLHQARRDLKTFLPVLRDWVACSQSFFEQCIHHEEEVRLDGRLELVVQWDKSYLELVEPDYVFAVKVGSDVVPDLEVPEWQEPVVDSPELPVTRPREITTEELALMEPFLIHKVMYVGLQANSQGKPCKSGVISIQNAGGGSLTGRAFATHPCIEVSPNRFRDKTQLTYWLDEASIPRDYNPVLVLRSGGDERQVTLAELRPLSRFNTLSKAQAVTLCFVPPVFGAIALNVIIAVQAKKIGELTLGVTEKIKQTAPDLWRQCQEHGTYIGGFFLLYAAVSSVLSLKIYQRLSHSLQDLVSKQFLRSIASPVIFLLLTALVNSFVFPGVRNAEITSSNLARLAPWGLVFASGGAVYTYLEFEKKFEEWIPDQALRRAARISVMMLFLFLWSLALT